MIAKRIAYRVTSVFTIAALGAVPVGAVMGVEVWKSAAQAGAAAVLNIAYRVAVAMRDGTISKQEEIDIFND